MTTTNDYLGRMFINQMTNLLTPKEKGINFNGLWDLAKDLVELYKPAKNEEKKENE